MAAEHFDYDPFTGMQTLIETIDLDRGVKIHLHHRQDVQDNLDYAADARADNQGDVGIKKGLWTYAHLPDTIILELKAKHNIDIGKMNREQWRRLFKLLNTDYKNFKMTNKTHTV
jgi:hypothetical protein